MSGNMGVRYKQYKRSQTINSYAIRHDILIIIRDHFPLSTAHFLVEPPANGSQHWSCQSRAAITSLRHLSRKVKIPAQQERSAVKVAG